MVNPGPLSPFWREKHMVGLLDCQRRLGVRYGFVRWGEIVGWGRGMEDKNGE